MILPVTFRANDRTNRPPPGDQWRMARYSISFFTRPGDDVILRPLKEHSRLIAAAVTDAPRDEYETGSTSKEWIARRIRKLRIKNRAVRHCNSIGDKFVAYVAHIQGPQTWYASMGTEHQGVREMPPTPVATAA